MRELILNSKEDIGKDYFGNPVVYDSNNLNVEYRDIVYYGHQLTAMQKFLVINGTAVLLPDGRVITRLCGTELY